MHKPGTLYAETSEKAEHYKRLTGDFQIGGVGGDSVPIPEQVLPAEGVIRWAEIKPGRELGKGGFGIVYQAKWRHDDVAVKKIKEELLQGNADGAARAEFRKELATRAAWSTVTLCNARRRRKRIKRLRAS